MSPIRTPAMRLSRGVLRAAAGALLCGSAVPALAQDDIDEIAEPVVQPIPGAAGHRLNAALELLARNPNDVDALLAAGKSALAMGDVSAAVGFYQRASVLSPGNPRIKAGLAGAQVRNEDPFTAITLFDEAEKEGPIEPELLADRALAYDLVGDNVTAQVFYKQALQAVRDDETVRRLALSQAIGGDRRGMELTLAPLLQKQDKAAWRARAFALAILGSTEEADSIARSSMPADMANGISGYLRFMPKLTAAQQAAAANLGHFPRAAEVGRDDPRLALYQRPRAVVARAEQSLTPTGKPLGGDRRSSRSTRRGNDSKPSAATPPPPVVSPSQVAVASLPAGSRPTELPAVTSKPATLAAASPPPVKVAPVAPVIAQTVAVKPAVVTPVASQTPAIPAATKPVQLAQAEPAVLTPPAARPVQTVVDESRPAPPPQPVAAVPTVAAKPATPPRDLSAVFADFVAPSREALPAPGAVDVRKIAARKPEVKGAKDPKAEKEAKKPEKPTHPSRIWVQVATGRNKAALAFDWRRLTRENAKLFGARKGFTSSWGQTNRLLTGPFENEKAASAFIAQIKKEKVDGAFLWTSPAGQVVDALAAGK